MYMKHYSDLIRPSTTLIYRTKCVAIDHLDRLDLFHRETSVYRRCGAMYGLVLVYSSNPPYNM